MFGNLVLAAVLLAAPAAWAQQETPPAVADVAAAKAHADAVIARGQAGAYFVNVTTTDIPLVRHVPSGMTCVFNVGDDRDNIAFYPVQEGGPAQGDDASCGTWWGTTYISMFATRYPQNYTADQVMGTAVSDLRRTWTNVVPREGEYPVAVMTGQEQPLVAVFFAEYQGRKAQTAIVVRHLGPWSFKARATGQADDADLPRTATLLFGVNLPGGWEIFQTGR